jgi:hypothetical protein
MRSTIEDRQISQHGCAFHPSHAVCFSSYHANLKLVGFGFASSRQVSTEQAVEGRSGSKEDKGKYQAEKFRKKK